MTTPEVKIKEFLDEQGLWVGIPLLLLLTCILLFFLAAYLTYNGWAFATIWGWLIVPVFGLPLLTIPQAIGVSIVVCYPFLKMVKSGQENHSWVVLWLRPLFMMGIAWVVKFFI